MKRTANLVLMIVFASFFLTGSNLLAYPDKPIEVIVPYAAGGGVDVTARLFAEQCKKYLPQPLIVINKTGGGGAVGLTAGAKAKPNGYTLTMITNSALSDQFYTKSVDYNQKSFIPITQVASDPAVLVVQTGGPYDLSLEKFLEYARKNPEKIRVGAGGTWSVQDTVRNLIEREAKVKFTKVPFTLLGGHIEATVAYIAEFKGHFDAGKLKPIAVSGFKRSPFLPDVPNFSEFGVTMPVDVWRILAAPAGTPESMLQILETAFLKTINDPRTRKAFNEAGIDLQERDMVSAQKFLEEQFRFYSKMVKDFGIEPK
jgi:tripartite-type tricarboxylate transporter receptor subunit TctC